MKPIIGIITRPSLSTTKKKIDILYEDIIKSVIKSGGIPIGIPVKFFNNKYLKICQGFIFSGGDDLDHHSLKILKVLYQKDIPTLGICLGMQEMNIINGGSLTDISNHQNNDMHKVIINKSSKLYKIIKKEAIIVNSRHKSAVLNTDLLVSSKSSDNVIESTEAKDKTFFTGFQWHPENIYDKSQSSKQIFSYFIKICKRGV